MCVGGGGKGGMREYSRASVIDNDSMTGSALIFSTGMHRWSIWYGQCGCVRIHLLAAMLQRRLGCRTRWLLLDCSRCSTAQSTAASKSSLFFLCRIYLSLLNHCRKAKVEVCKKSNMRAALVWLVVCTQATCAHTSCPAVSKGLCYKSEGYSFPKARES